MIRRSPHCIAGYVRVHVTWMADGWRLDVMQIRFKVPVDVSGCRVIPASATPHAALLPSFSGQTKPATFTVEVFAKSLRFPSDRFQRLARPFTFSGDANAQLDVEVRPQTATSLHRITTLPHVYYAVGSLPPSFFVPHRQRRRVCLLTRCGAVRCGGVGIRSR